MNRLMLAILLAMVVRVGIPNTMAAEPARDGVFIHIGRGNDDPHRLLMALSMADIMADGSR